jgi:hypothetical protein
MGPLAKDPAQQHHESFALQFVDVRFPLSTPAEHMDEFAQAKVKKVWLTLSLYAKTAPRSPVENDVVTLHVGDSGVGRMSASGNRATEAPKPSSTLASEAVTNGRQAAVEADELLGACMSTRWT